MEADVIGVFTEATTADVEAVLADETTTRAANTAVPTVRRRVMSLYTHIDVVPTAHSLAGALRVRIPRSLNHVDTKKADENVPLGPALILAYLASAVRTDTVADFRTNLILARLSI